MLTYHIYRPEEGMTEGGKALARMLSDESPGKSYAEVMRLRVAGALAGECTDTYFVALDAGKCVSRLWNGWGRHEGAIGNFGNFLTLEEYRGLCPEVDEGVYEAIDLYTCVTKRISAGGTGPDSVKAQLAFVKEFLEA